MEELKINTLDFDNIKLQSVRVFSDTDKIFVNFLYDMAGTDIFVPIMYSEKFKCVVSVKDKNKNPYMKIISNDTSKSFVTLDAVCVEYDEYITSLADLFYEEEMHNESLKSIVNSVKVLWEGAGYA